MVKIDFAFDAPIPITANEPITLVYSAGKWAGLPFNQDVYQPGAVWQSVNGGSYNMLEGARDIDFTTYVVDVIPTSLPSLPQWGLILLSALLLALGVKGLSRLDIV